MRDHARSDLYLAQLRSEFAPNTPGSGSMSPRSDPLGPQLYVDPHCAEKSGEHGKMQYAHVRGIAQPQPFALQASPIGVTGATPKIEQDSFEAASAQMNNILPSPPSRIFQERRDVHIDAAPGERQYAAVPIPGAYTPLESPSYPLQQQQ
jgi:hypothetical protein